MIASGTSLLIFSILFLLLYIEPLVAAAVPNNPAKAKPTPPPPAIGLGNSGLELYVPGYDSPIEPKLREYGLEPILSKSKLHYLCLKNLPLYYPILKNILHQHQVNHLKYYHSFHHNHSCLDQGNYPFAFHQKQKSIHFQVVNIHK
mgnify:CR=1 FL=1